MASGIFQRLMIARQLKFSEGSIELFGGKCILFPTDFLGKFVYDLKDDSKYTLNLYHSIKNSTRAAPIFSIPKNQTLTTNDLIKRMVDVINFEGWGIISFDNLDVNSGKIEMKNSAFAECLKEKVSRPCDHILRGILAGTLSVIYNKDIDVVEVECEAIGANKCLFIYEQLAKLNEKYGEIVTQQIEEKKTV